MNIKVESLDAGKRLDVFVSEKIDKSRSFAQKLIKEKKVLVNGEEAKPNFKVHLDDEVEIEEIEVEHYEIKAQKMDLNIVYEDDHLIVINKPSNMVVHPAPGNYDNTLVNGLMFYANSLSDINGEFRPGIVHRIDKDTSGLIIVAKTNEAHSKLSDMMKDRAIKRKYKAIVHGSLLEKEAKIIAPIGRDVKDRKKMTVTDKNSKEAITLVKLLDSNENYSLIECSLQTGRTHQIRVHLKYIGHPVLGDPKYGPKKTIDTNGQALHAYKLDFTHPVTGESMSFEATVPEEFKNSLEKTGLKDV